MVSDAIILLSGLGIGLVLLCGVYFIVRQPHLLATPNARSSHSQPTPTMGGVVIVVIVLAYLAVLAELPGSLGWTSCFALAALALVGLWDDLSHLSARFRLAVHFVAAAAALWALGLDLPLWLQALFCVALVWFVNLYNFMDGIDGYAAVQCLVFCLGAQWVGGGLPGWSGDLVWLLAGATLAFLAFNWPPARIFMGDVGSGFLGLLLGVMVLYLWQTGSVPLVASLILLAVFWFDATYTLCVRMLTRQEFTQAHRSHLYQHLAQRQGHLWTTVAFLLYAAIVLVPLAWYASLSSSYPQQLGALFIAVAPLAVACVRLRAGQPGVPHSDLADKEE